MKKKSLKIHNLLSSDVILISCQENWCFLNSTQREIKENTIALEQFSNRTNYFYCEFAKLKCSWILLKLCLNFSSSYQYFPAIRVQNSKLHQSQVMIELSTICQILLLYYHTALRFNILTSICMHLTSYIPVVHVHVYIYMYLFTALPDNTHTVSHHCQVRFTTKHLSSERLHKWLQLTLGPHNKCWRKKKCPQTNRVTLV